MQDDWIGGKSHDNFVPIGSLPHSTCVRAGSHEFKIGEVTETEIELVAENT